MVDILIGAIPPVHNDQRNGDNSRRQTHKKKTAAERRKKRADRRRSVRQGVIVTLSKYPERRKGTERRKAVYSPDRD